MRLGDSASLGGDQLDRADAGAPIPLRASFRRPSSRRDAGRATSTANAGEGGRAALASTSRSSPVRCRHGRHRQGARGRKDPGESRSSLGLGFHGARLGDSASASVDSLSMPGMTAGAGALNPSKIFNPKILSQCPLFISKNF